MNHIHINRIYSGADLRSVADDLLDCVPGKRQVEGCVCVCSSWRELWNSCCKMVLGKDNRACYHHCSPLPPGRPAKGPWRAGGSSSVLFLSLAGWDNAQMLKVPTQHQGTEQLGIVQWHQVVGRREHSSLLLLLDYHLVSSSMGAGSRSSLPQRLARHKCGP